MECQGVEYEGLQSLGAEYEGLQSLGAEYEGCSVKVHIMKNGMSRCRL